MNKETLSLIGLMYKAGKLVLGEDAYEKMDKVVYLLVASDVSEKTLDRYQRKCEHYDLKIDQSFSSADLSNALGKKVVKVIGLTDEGFKKTLLKKL